MIMREFAKLFVGTIESLNGGFDALTGSAGLVSEGAGTVRQAVEQDKKTSVTSMWVERDRRITIGVTGPPPSTWQEPCEIRFGGSGSRHC